MEGRRTTTPRPGPAQRSPGSLVNAPPRAHLGCVVRLAPRARGSPLATLAYRGIAVALAALALAGQVAYLDALSWRALGPGTLAIGSMRPGLLSAVIGGAVVSVAAALLGTAVGLKGAPERGALPMGSALAAWAYMLAYSGIVVLLAPAHGMPLRPVFEGHFLAVEAFALAAMIRFTSVFPEPLRPHDLREPHGLPVGLRSVQRLRRWLVRPAAPWIAALVASVLSVIVNAWLRRDLQDAALLPIVDLFRLGALAVVVLNLRHAFVASGPAGRTRLGWIVLGFMLLVGAVGCVLGGNVLVAATGWDLPGVHWRPLVLDAGVLGLLGGAAMAIFHGGALRPGPLVRRTAVLGAFATLALFLAAGLEMILSGAVATRFSLPHGTGTVLAAVTAAVVWRRTQRPLEAFLAHAWGEADPPLAVEPRERPVA